MEAFSCFVVIFTARFPQSKKNREICGNKYILIVSLCLCWQISAHSKNFRKWHPHHSPLFTGLMHGS